jgi:response regulator of citrate/malate metabolism
MINILIVEDDPMVSDLNKRYINSVEGFKVIGQARDGEAAMKFCRVHDVDLIILDIYMPKMDGLMFLQDLRKRKMDIDVILVTASVETHSIDSALKLGAVDYLVKPFEYERLKKALCNYFKRRCLLDTDEIKSQKDLDKMLGKLELQSNASIIKGLNKKTLERIRDFMRNNIKYFTSEEVAERLDLTKVTVRKYLEYLHSTNELELEIEYGTIGRPSNLYKFIE